MLALLLSSTAFAQAPPESLGGVILGAKLNPDEMSCESATCRKQANIAGVAGVLVVTKCGDIAWQIRFSRMLLDYTQLGPRTDADLRSLADIGTFVTSEMPSDLARSQEALSAGLASTGWLLAASSTTPGEPSVWSSTYRHPDGRSRWLTVTLNSAVVGGRPLTSASVDLYTQSLPKCISGL